MDSWIFCMIVVPHALLIGIPALFRPSSVEQWLEKIQEETELLRVVGYFWSMMAVLVLVKNPSVGTDVEGLVGLLAWGTLIKCVFLCWWPARVVSARKKIYGKIRWWFGVLICSVATLLFMAALHLKEIQG